MNTECLPIYMSKYIRSMCVCLSPAGIQNGDEAGDCNVTRACGEGARVMVDERCDLMLRKNFMDVVGATCCTTMYSSLLAYIILDS